MKKTVIIIMTLALASAAAFAQTKVQNKFLGLEMGQPYKAIFECPELMETASNNYNWSPLKDVPVRCIQIPSVSFGGRYWNYMEYSFSPSGIFYKFRVYSDYDSPKDAEPRYTSLMSDLDLKYLGKSGITREEDDSFNPKSGDSERSVTYRDGQGMECRLVLEYSQSTNNGITYFLMLYYIDTKLEAAAKAEFVREL